MESRRVFFVAHLGRGKNRAVSTTGWARVWDPIGGGGIVVWISSVENWRIWRTDGFVIRDGFFGGDRNKGCYFVVYFK